MWQVTAACLAGGLATLLAVAELYNEFGLPEGTLVLDALEAF